MEFDQIPYSFLIAVRVFLLILFQPVFLQNKKLKTMTELNNYQKEELTINIAKANLFGILILIPVGLVFGLPFYFLWRGEPSTFDIISGLKLNFIWISLVVFVIGVIAHELIHGIVWSIFAKRGFRSIKFGVVWKMLTPYCHCSEPLKVKHYIFGGITPAVILGIIPAIVALFTGSFALLIFGIVFTVAASGDFLIVRLLWKENPNDFAEDHPSEAGCFIYRKIKIT